MPVDTLRLLEIPTLSTPPEILTVPKSASNPLAAPKKPRYRSLDVWRGLACLMVVLLHSSFYAKSDISPSDQLHDPVGTQIMLLVSRMGIGVWIFFVISGYCIAATADSTRRKDRVTAQYFERRFRRIFPPYWLMLLITIGVVWLISAAGGSFLFSDEHSIPHPETLTETQWIGNITLTETWLHHLLGSTYQLQLGPSWTLCYEEQFYAVCGFILLLAPRRFFAGVVTVTLFTIFTTIINLVKQNSMINGFFFDGRWLIFAAGVLVYYQVNYASGIQGRLFLSTLFLCLALSVIIRYGILARIGTWEQKDRAFEFVASSAFALLISLLHPWDDRIAESPVLRPIALCGTMCYSLYLVHWPVTKLISHSFYLIGVRGIWPTLLITLPTAVGVSIGLSWIFHLTIERRFLNSPSLPASCMLRTAEVMPATFPPPG